MIWCLKSAPPKSAVLFLGKIPTWVEQKTNSLWCISHAFIGSCKGPCRSYRLSPSLGCGSTLRNLLLVLLALQSDVIISHAGRDAMPTQHVLYPGKEWKGIQKHCYPYIIVFHLYGWVYLVPNVILDIIALTHTDEEETHIYLHGDV